MKRTFMTTTLFAALAGVFFTPAAQQSVQQAAILPTVTVGTDAANGTLFNDALYRELETVPTLAVKTKAETAGKLDGFGKTDFSQCGAGCAAEFGKAAGVDLVVAGSLGRIGNLYSFTVVVTDVKNGRNAWSKEYQGKTALESFYMKVPAKVRADMIQALFPQLANDGKPATAETIGGAEPVVQEAVTQTMPVIEDADDDLEVQVQASNRGDIAIVTAPTVGISGRTIVSNPEREQSRFGVTVMYLHPTTPKSHVRLIAGVPLTKSSETMGREDLKIPDASVSLEHEWGMRYFGVTAGLAFTNLYRFTTTAEYYSNTPPETVEFPTVQTYNFVFAVRGGKPTAGFRGKISWPMPFLLDWDEPMNYVFEYSAIGMFGNEKVKGGIGIQGAYKKREVESPYQPDPSYYYDPYVNIERANEFYIMVPCGKLAFLAGKHSVVTASVDLGGLILPVQVGSGLWTPSIGLQYVYSFGELKSANAFDGSF